ncbi:MAG: AMP-binding protein [bacterium]
MNLCLNLWKSADQYPERPAVRFYERTITYGELRNNVARLAAGFNAMGIAHGTRIALAMPNIPEFIISYYAALAAGAAVVPVNPLYTPYELNYIIGDSAPSVIITHPLTEAAASVVSREKSIPLLFADNFGDTSKKTIYSVMSEQADEKLPVEIEDDETAAVIYTNAVGGIPLGAQLTHGGLAFDAEKCAVVAGVECEDVFLTVIPLYHAFSATVCMNLPILRGALTILHETFDEQRTFTSLHRECVTIFPAVPTIFKRILDRFCKSGITLPHLKAPIPGGAPTPQDVITGFEDAFGALVFEGYGITECGPVTSVNPITRRIRKIGSIGPPLEEIDVKITDANGNSLPADTDGELCVRGRNVMKGYLNNEEATRQFLKDGWFHTGDLARIDEDGFIFITGRKKRMIIVGGFNVYPAEVEKALLNHEAIAECEVFGVPDGMLGERVAARIRLRTGKTADKGEIQKFTRNFLAPYKIPRTIEIIAWSINN